MRLKKKAILDELDRSYKALATTWGVTAAKIRPFENELNNARLNSMATYHDLVPAFENIRQKCGGDWNAFYREVQRIGKLPKAERKRALQNELANAASNASRG
jgi:predicted aminopeptidase